MQNFNLVLYDQTVTPTPPTTKDRQRQLQGAAPGWWWTSGAAARSCSGPLLSGKSVLDEDAEITVSAKPKKELRESQRIARIPLPPITAGLLVFVPDIVVTVNLKGSGSRGAKSEPRRARPGGRRFIRQRLQQDQRRRHLLGITPAPPSRQREAMLPVSPHAALWLMLYGVAGIPCRGRALRQVRGVYPGTPAWTMRYGIEGNLGVDIDLLILSKD
ncbi:MAG: hypothetical protein IPP44_00160 [Ideonella sp.]|nr:hypothetical protein [Ideonella sp.]